MLDCGAAASAKSGYPQNQLFMQLHLGSVVLGRRHMEARRRAGQCLLFLRHALDDPLEQGRREVALAGIRQHAQDHCAWSSLLSDLHSHREGRTTRNPGENAFLLRQLL